MCCLFGLLDYSGYFSHRQKNTIMTVLSAECEVRGADATGIAYNSGDTLRVYKRPLAASRMWYRLPPKVSYIMGHTRLTTQGSEKHNYNNHPFIGTVETGQFALAHNGVLGNDAMLRKDHELPQTKIETDSYVAVQLLEQCGELDFESLRTVAEAVRGSFTFTILDSRDSLYFVKGDSPMCIYHYADRGFYLYASTEEILKAAIKRLGLGKLRCERVAISCGDILRIDSGGGRKAEPFDTSALHALYHGYFTPCTYSFLENRLLGEEDDYIELLKNTASAFGYSPDDIDAMLVDGYSPEEIENLFYEEDGFINDRFRDEF